MLVAIAPVIPAVCGLLLPCDSVSTIVYCMFYINNIS